MKICLHCKDEFQEKKDTAKYCSTSCRVMYNRNKPKKSKGLSTESKLEVLCNTVMDMLSGIKYSQITPNSYDGKNVSHITHDEPPMFTTKHKIKRSQEYFAKIILNGGCDEPEDHKIFIQEVNDSDLPDRIKQNLIAASRVRQS